MLYLIWLGLAAIFIALFGCWVSGGQRHVERRTRCIARSPDRRKSRHIYQAGLNHD